MSRKIEFPVTSSVPASTAFVLDGITITGSNYSSDANGGRWYPGYVFDNNTRTQWYVSGSSGTTHTLTLTFPNPIYLIGYTMIMGEYYDRNYKLYFDNVLAYSRTIANYGTDGVNFSPKLVKTVKLAIGPTDHMSIVKFRLFKLADSLATVKVNDSIYSFDDSGNIKLTSSTPDITPTQFLNEGFNIQDTKSNGSKMLKQIQNVGKTFKVVAIKK